jgi:hypothetical protein
MNASLIMTSGNLGTDLITPKGPQHNVGIAQIQMPALQQYITSPKNPSVHNSISMDRKGTTGGDSDTTSKNVRDYQLI